MDRIRRILVINPPAGDVYELMTILLSYATGLMVFLVVLILLKGCIESEECSRPTNNATIMEEAELEAFRPLETSIITSAHRASLPTDYPKSLQHHVTDLSAWSLDTGISELPPSYSIAEPIAGRNPHN
ncbi:hypothetical protein J1614_005355 [Plenodomus biglobosus]|nr:hypothetical protein J1614_005355 [Plenodomus biglobosus]